MPTTIQISDEMRVRLEKMKLFARESFNEIIERMVEDELELNEQTKQEIGEARKGKTISHDEVKKRFGL